MIPIARIVAVLMGAVVCFGMIVPLALQRHNAVLAALISLLYVAYAVANIVLWKRMNRRA